jgi:ribosomal protein L29
VKFVSTLIIATVLLPSPWADARPVSYNRDVRPVLSNNCFFCHGFDKDKREADLRLDTAEGAAEVIKAGDPDASELFKRITTKDPDDVMPPADSVYSLTSQQIETLRLWIAQGAEYEEHWAYKDLSRPTVPGDGKSNPIDAFLKEGWEEHGMKPTEQADPRTAIRRLSFDLRGLPPTAAEVADFEKDPSAERFGKFAKLWTRSTEYAEQQGLHWLDLVRWADSSGMVSDEPLATGEYRKYVIEAFRENIPFDRFTREQLAGDLLPNADDQSLIASAYNRLVKTNSEAAVIEKEALHALKGEHVRALGTVWLGTTTGCAECHDHKYDPVSAKDYYSLAAFFDDLIEVGVYEPGDRRQPLHYLYGDAVEKTREAELGVRVEDLRKRIYEAPLDEVALKKWSGEMLAAFDALKNSKQSAEIVWAAAELPPAYVSEGKYETTATGRKVSAEPGKMSRHLAAELMTSEITGKAESLFVDVTIDPNDAPTLIALQAFNGAYGRMGWHPDYTNTYYWGEKDDPALANKPEWITGEKRLIRVGPLPELGKTVRLKVPSKLFPKTQYATVGLGWTQAGGTVVWGDSGYSSDARNALNKKQETSVMRYWWELPLNRDDRNKFPTLLEISLRMKAEEIREIHTQVIALSFRESTQPDLVRELDKAYAELFRLRQSAGTTLVSKTGAPKETRLRHRGSFMDDSGPLLAPAVLERFEKVKPDGRATRLDLADWIVSPENPLTARVFVNRLWEQFYGRGLCATVDDVGNQGEWPSNTELIDWLAAEFIESGWDMRHMVELMVSTEAYRLSSVRNQALAEQDPLNRYLARQSAHRHSAEEIRDSALAAAGLLKTTAEIPVKSFFPYQPDAYWEKSNKIMFGSRYQIWDTAKGDEQYQRSLYTYWKRQNPHPSMLAFDAPTRQECSAQRTITNTPGQALALLNDPVFVEAGRVLAQEAMAETADAEGRLRFIFQRVLQREPEPEELSILLPRVEEWTAYFSENPGEANDFLGIGQAPADIGFPAAERAAWSNCSRLILNLHEFLTRS